MGLDAFVTCNCWRDGKSKPPPVPRERIRLDADGWLELDMPEPIDPELQQAFDEWSDDPAACSHSDMDAAFERISNYGGFRHFEYALHTLGAERFPTLTKIPIQGSTQASASAHALEELELFRRICRIPMWDIVESETGEVAIRDVPPEGRFILRGKKQPYDLWADRYGIFFVPTERLSPGGIDGTQSGPSAQDRIDAPRRGPDAVFASARFEQVGVGGDKLDPVVQYTDLETGRTITTTHALFVGGEDHHKGRLATRCHIVSRPLTAEDFEYILAPLKIVFEASARTGNSVIWC